MPRVALQSSATLIRCPKCQHVLAEQDGSKFTVSVAVRGRKRREISGWSKVEIRCDDCGHLALFEAVADEGSAVSARKLGSLQ